MKFTERITILHIANLQSGGIATLVKEMALYQRNHLNYTVGILQLLGDKNENDKKLLSPLMIFYGELKSGFDLSLKKYSKILRVIRKFDLIHLHGFSPILSILLIVMRKKIIYTEHGTFQKANLKLSLKKYFKKRVMGFFFLKHFCSAVVFNSEWLKDNVNLKTKNVFVIRNGASQKGCLRVRDYDKRVTKVLFIGRLVVRKKVDRLIRSFSRLENIKKFQLNIVGDGVLYNDLLTLAKEKIPVGCFRFFGEQTEVSKFYEEADIFVLPTQYEPFGLVVVEAMLCGLIVLCFNDAGGALEIIGGIHDKLIAQNEDELTSFIEYWSFHAEERIKLGKELRRRAKELFSVERMSEEYSALYKKILSGQ